MTIDKTFVGIIYFLVLSIVKVFSWQHIENIFLKIIYYIDDDLFLA